MPKAPAADPDRIEPETVQLQIRMSPKLQKRLRKAAYLNDRSMSAVARHYIEAGLKADGIVAREPHRGAVYMQPVKPRRSRKPQAIGAAP